MPIVSRYPVDLILLVLVTLIQAMGVRLLWRTAAARASQRVRTAIIAGTAVSFTILLLGVLIQRSGLAGSLPVWITTWGRGMVAAWALTSSLAPGSTIAVMPEGPYVLARCESGIAA